MQGVGTVAIDAPRLEEFLRSRKEFFEVSQGGVSQGGLARGLATTLSGLRRPNVSDRYVVPFGGLASGGLARGLATTLSGVRRPNARNARLFLFEVSQAGVSQGGLARGIASNCVLTPWEQIRAGMLLAMSHLAFDQVDSGGRCNSEFNGL